MKTSVVWFRKSLRLHDNPALTAACEDKNIDSILPLYILDPDTLGENYQKWSPNRLRFLIESLSDLDHQLSSQYGSRLFILQGSPDIIFENMADQLGQTLHSINCEYCSEPWDRKKFSSLQKALEKKNASIRIQSFSAFQTILDVEKAVSSTDYRNPKSMKDIDRIFSSHFDKDEHGFYKI
jgi:deoxyribodipyrimidine photo-lyase